MFSKLFQRSTPEKPIDEILKHFPSPHGDRPNVSRTPLLVYGHSADTTAKTISESSTISCLAVEGLDNLVRVLDGRPLIGFQAMSPRNSPGEAARAIALFHSQYPKLMALYGSWSYNVERTAQRAIACGAQGIVMPGIVVDELMHYMLLIGRRTDSGYPAPQTVEEHEALLWECATTSPFWQLQAHPDGPDY